MNNQPQGMKAPTLQYDDNNKAYITTPNGPVYIKTNAQGKAVDDQGAVLANQPPEEGAPGYAPVQGSTAGTSPGDSISLTDYMKTLPDGTPTPNVQYDNKGNAFVTTGSGSPVYLDTDSKGRLVDNEGTPLQYQSTQAPATATGGNPQVVNPPVAQNQGSQLKTLPSDGSITAGMLDENGCLKSDSSTCYKVPSADKPYLEGGNKNGGSEDKSQDVATSGNDPCKTAQALSAGVKGSKDYSCGGTQSLVENTQVTATVGQIGGQMVMGAMGQSTYNNLAQNGASQSQSMEAAANLQEKAGMLQTALGATQLYMGFQEHSQGSQHLDDANDFKATASQGTYKPELNPSSTMLTPTGPEMRVQSTGKDLQHQIADNALFKAGAPIGTVQSVATVQGAVKSAASAGGQAMSEEQGVGNKAQQSGTMDMIKGGGVAFMGMMAMMAAQQEKDAAAKLNTGGGAVPTGADPFTPLSNSGEGTTAITGSGTDPNPTSTNPANNPGMPTSQGFNVPGGPPGSGVAQAGPAPGAFVPAQPNQDAGAMGGGDMGMGSGTAPAAAAGNGDPSPQYADKSLSGDGAGYSGQGSMGGGHGGDSGNPALSLKDAFAQLLGGNQNQRGSGNDILAYRKLASDSFNPLGQQEDFFKVIHSAYENLQKKGQIGR